MSATTNLCNEKAINFLTVALEKELSLRKDNNELKDQYQIDLHKLLVKIIKKHTGGI